MLIAHLPAGYILTKFMQKKSDIQCCLWLGLLGSIFPDFDIMYLYIAEDTGTFHRQYWTHLPIFWLCITMIFFVTTYFINFNKKVICGGLFFLMNIWGHLILDTTMAPVYWLKPLMAKGFQLFDLNIAPVYASWFFNYMMHPFFLSEITLCIGAIVMWISSRNKLKQYSLLMS
jgi:inner membrane protein